ncbi:hypothetical protein [Streptomyces sp. NPDC088196]|uniref:hypothetical protein n=1 Tax=Streptomyces sp. NPDC088196 TaxID=3154868 RepID=UPI00344B92A9
MALTRQFARVTPDYLDRCRSASPGWDPPDDHLLDRADISAALHRVQLGDLLADMPASTEPPHPAPASHRP